MLFLNMKRWADSVFDRDVGLKKVIGRLVKAATEFLRYMFVSSDLI